MPTIVRATSSSGRAVSYMLGMRETSIVSRQIRWNSTQPNASGGKPVSPHVGFYKTFTRPIAKVLLMSIFVYQLAYWGWVKLEKDEIKKERKAEIERLEKQLGELKGKGKSTTP